MGDKVVKKELKKLEQEDLVRLRHELSGTFASIVTVSKYVGIKVDDTKKQQMLKETTEAAIDRIKNLTDKLYGFYIPTGEK